MQPWYRKALDFIYPSTCHSCSCKLKDGWSLCEPCKESLRKVSDPMCQKCGECFDGAISTEFTCPNCNQLDLVFDFARAAYQSSEESIDLIYQFKYQKKIYLSKELGRLTNSALSSPRFHNYLQNGLLVPVPLHWRRYQKRTFNQSEEIAKVIRKLNPQLRTINALQRTRYTQTQTSFSRAKRLHNLKGAFQVRKKHQNFLKNRNLILVDDVFTTGSTANECTKALLAAGAKQVAVLTFLRG